MEEVKVEEEVVTETVAEVVKEPLDPEAILEVRNLKKYFPVESDFFGRPTKFLKAVDDVSFKIKQGTTLGIVGESGCGKTTLGRTILRLHPSTEGEIYFDGKDINKLSMPELDAIWDKNKKK
jgi:peptide/nickel transport system ATP-binding protein